MGELKIDNEIINTIGVVCDAALRARGLNVINDVNKIMSWLGNISKVTPITESKKEAKDGK